MASLPRIVRAWRRVPSIPRPAPAAVQPSSEPEPEILPLAPTIQTLQPSEPKPPPSSPLREPTRISSPAKKAASPAASPKYEATVASLPVKPAGSPPVSPSRKSSDPRRSISPSTYNEPLKPTTPPLPTLALPQSADVTTIKSRIQPNLEQKTSPYKKSVEEPNRQAEYGSEKPIPTLALPQSADVTTIKSRIQPEVEQKTSPYKKSVEEPNRQAEYGSGKPLPTLALPQSADVTTIKSRIQPKVVQKTRPYKKSVEEPNRQAEYGSEKPPQKELTEDINLTGHNVGTVMEISQFPGDRSGGVVTRKMETETGVRYEHDEGKTGVTEKIQRATGFSLTPFINSNFQEVNNSVMYNSSCTGRDPGLHLDFSGEKKDDRSIDDGGEKYKS